MAERKPKRTVYHVTPDKEAPTSARWQVQHKAGRHEMSQPHRTQHEAIAAARRQAKQHKPAQVVVHGTDGRIRTEYTYGDDPRDILG